MTSATTRGVDRVAKAGSGALSQTGNIVQLFIDVARQTFVRPFQWREFIQQAWFIASVTILPTALVAIPFGAIVSLQTGSLIRQLGAESFTGAASVVEYQQLLQSVTLTSQMAGIRSVSFTVTDDQGNESQAAGTLVTVVGLSVQVPPLVVTTPVAAGTAGGVITVSPVVIITDLDSGEEVWLREGRLFDAIRASMATPLVFTPFKRVEVE